MFVDCDDTFCIDVDQLEQAITPRTKAIMPVHLTGDVAEMPRIMEIAKRTSCRSSRTAAKSLMGEYNGKRVGTWGDATAFSMHPLKIINVWGDAGIVVTNDDEMNRRVRLLRNHGLRNRDEMEILGYNSRLDSTQAVVGKWIVRQLPEIVERRIANAAYYDAGFRSDPQCACRRAARETKNVYLLYILFARGSRRAAQSLHRQRHRGQGPLSDPAPPAGRARHARLQGRRLPGRRAALPARCISFPVDQHLSRAEQDYVIETVREFYAGRRR